MSTNRRRAWLLAVSLWALTCVLAAVGHSQGSGLPRIADAVRFYPGQQANYVASYATAVACTGTRHPRPYAAVVWLRVPRSSFLDTISGSAEERKLANIGEWIGPDSIFIATGYLDSWVVTHELVHYLRQDGKHPMKGNRNVLFGEACHATWGYLLPDTTVSGPGTTIRGPAYPTEPVS